MLPSLANGQLESPAGGSAERDNDDLSNVVEELPAGLWVPYVADWTGRAHHGDWALRRQARLCRREKLV